ncbi:MAG: GAF domain-containing protein [Thermoleophilaceae bacterium]|nr:GAF domain-containing protein [Thermoleophilaceae bacterium]
MSKPKQTPAHSARHAIPSLELLVGVLSGAEHDLDSGQFYSHLAEAVCRVADMRRAVIFRYDDASRRVRAAGGHGVDLDAFADSHISVESSPEAALALADERVIEICPPERHRISPEFAELVGDHALIYVPIAAGGRWHGVIIAEPEPNVSPLDDVRRDLLWTLGKTLALVSVARIATFHGERARQLEERIDLARDVHDRVVQRLFGVSLAVSADSPIEGEARRRIAEEVQTALVELRSALQRPLGRTSRTTATTLAAELERLSSKHPDLNLRVDGEIPALPEHLEALAQSVLTEAVRNARKHANPTALIVTACREDGVFVLEVSNDGVSAHRRGGAPGMGLRLAALEALQAGGVVEFGERENGHWRVRLAVPEAP